MIDEKSILRKKYLKIRRDIPSDSRFLQSKRITASFLSSDEYKNAMSIFAYVSLDDEVVTRELIERMLLDGKIVSVPFCDKEKNIMYPIRISSFADLKKGAYGIEEPEFCKEKVMAKKDIDITIVPMVASDRALNRLGYGGGYYDRFLADFNGKSIGFCFCECLAEELPADKFDIKLNRIIY